MYLPQVKGRRIPLDNCEGYERHGIKASSSLQQKRQKGTPRFSRCHSPGVRDRQILRRGRLRERDFLNTKWCARVKQLYFGEKTW